MHPSRPGLPRTARLIGGLALTTVLFLSTLPAFAQRRTLEPRPKDPTKALVFSALVPGGGHIYAGERSQGLFLMLGSAAALVGGTVLSDFERDFDYTCSNSCIGVDTYDPNYTPLLVGVGIAGALWLYGLIDAPGAVRRANQRRSTLASVTASPVPLARGRRLQPGVSMHITF